MAAGTGGEPAAQGREREALREVPQRQPVRPQLRLQVRAESTRLDPRGAADPVDLQDPVQPRQVQGEDTGMLPGAVLDPADDRTARPVRDHGDIRPGGPVEQLHHVPLLPGAGDQIRRGRHVPVQRADHVPEGLAVGVGRPVGRGGGHEMGEGGGRAHPDRRQRQRGDRRNRERRLRRPGDQSGERDALRVGQRLVEGAPAPPGADGGAVGPGRRGRKGRAAVRHERMTFR